MLRQLFLGEPMSYLHKLNLALLAVFVSVVPALAQGHRPKGGGRGVPEIDTSAGLLTIAAIAIVGIISYNRTRR